MFYLTSRDVFEESMIPGKSFDTGVYLRSLFFFLDTMSFITPFRASVEKQTKFDHDLFLELIKVHYTLSFKSNILEHVEDPEFKSTSYAGVYEESADNLLIKCFKQKLL